MQREILADPRHPGVDPSSETGLKNTQGARAWGFSDFF